ncbi:MAG: hypothetical protein HQL11_00940 [Candidatus Omnitrophica bacterium]|nr:hypothetical protein [Candidatus Omnitrophota bacterium]
MLDAGIEGKSGVEFEDLLRQDLDARALWRGEKLTMHVENRFQPRTKFSTQDRADLNSEGNHVNSLTDQAGAGFGYQWNPKLRFDFRYGFEYHLYPIEMNEGLRGVDSNNVRTESYSYGITYDPSPKTRLKLGYLNEDADYFEGGVFASQVHEVSGELLMRITPKTAISQSLAYQYFDYSWDRLLGNEGLRYRMAVDYKINPKIRLTGYLMRELREDLSLRGFADDSGSVLKLERSAGARLDAFLSPSVRLALDARLVADESERSFFLPGIPGSGQTILEPLTEDEYSWGAYLNWKFMLNADWFLGYRYINRISNDAGKEHQNHQIRSSVRWLFG